jgi:hypothetical protein
MTSLLEKASKLDPENITVDTMRMLFKWTPRWLARQILETGVRRGEFERKPDGSYRVV